MKFGKHVSLNSPFDFSFNTDIMLQGFNWDAHAHSAGWYNAVKRKAEELGRAEFDMIWLPPPSDAASAEGYLPRQLYKLNSAYGSKRELIGLIKELHVNGLKVIADIVINHRVGTHNWADFTHPSWGSWAVTANDEWAIKGGQLCGNWDTGDSFEGGRDLDHTNAKVQADIINWLNWLKKGIGFDGWRYDFTRGYAGHFNRLYNQATAPYFSVGELWDVLDLENVDAHRQQLVDWIDSTFGTSTAFDFTTKGVLQQAVNGELWRLSIKDAAPGLIGWKPGYAVTFIDNHDTGSSQNHWPFPADKVLLGYVYILTHPGIPCVFWDHYFDWDIRGEIEGLIKVRKGNKLHSRSTLQIKAAKNDLYAAEIDEKVAIKIGPGAWQPNGKGWNLRLSGNDYGVWERVW